MRSRRSTYTAEVPMNPALRRQCDALRRLFSKASTDEIHTRYRIATIVSAVQTAADKYGARGVERLARALDLDRTTLYRYAWVAQRFDRATIGSITRRDHHSSLSWSHLIVLSTIEQESRRKELLTRAMAGLSVRELEQLARGKDPVQVAASSLAGLRQLLTITESLKSRAMADVEVDEPSQEAIDLISRIVHSQEELKEACDRSTRRLRQLRAQLEAALQPRSARPTARKGQSTLAGYHVGT